MLRIVTGVLTLPPIVTVVGVAYLMACETGGCSSLASFAALAVVGFLGQVAVDGVPRLWQSNRMTTRVVIGMLWITAGVLIALRITRG